MLDVYGQLVQGVEPRVLLSGYNQFTSLPVGRQRRRSVVKVEAVQLGLVVVFGDRDPGLTCTHGEQESEYTGKGGWQASKGGNGGARRTLLGAPRFAETAQRAALIQLRHNFQPLFCARRPAQKVSCAARRHRLH